MQKFIVLLFLLSTAAFAAAAPAPPTKPRADSIRALLPSVKTPADSLRMLYDIFDIETSPGRRLANAPLLYQTAERAGDYSAQLDVLRLVSAACATDLKALGKIRREAQTLPRSEELAQTQLFLDLYIILEKARGANEQTRQKQIRELLKQRVNGTQAGNWFKQVKDLYTLCVYLSLEGSGELVAEYTDKLEKKLNERQNLLYALRNLYLVTAAMNYTQANRPEMAINCERELLKVINGLEKYYASKGRKFRNYDVQKYISYRRLLRNYNHLSPAEIEQYYNAAKALIAKVPVLASSEQTTPQIEAFYLMSKKNYQAALPLLKKVVADNKSHNREHPEALRMLIEAATATGDNATRIEALQAYNSILEEKQKEEGIRLYKELQIKYDINELKAHNAQLELEKRDAQIANTRVVIWIVSGACLIFLVLLIVLLIFYRHAHKLSGSLSNAVNNLEHERDALKRIQGQLITARDRAQAANTAKDEFLHSMSHELRTPLNAIMGFSQLMVKKIPESIVPKIKHFSSQIIFNTDLLKVLINDILYLSSIDTHSPGLTCQKVSANTLLGMAVDWTSKQLARDVSVDCSMSASQIMLTTDRDSVEEVLMKLLGNAAKFTKKGKISIVCTENTEEGTVSFIVEDTGPGIPEGHEEEIFERFVKLDSFVQGTGLGLYICRRIATSLNGKIYVDTSYKKGARFVFTIPRDMKNPEEV